MAPYDTSPTDNAEVSCLYMVFLFPISRVMTVSQPDILCSLRYHRPELTLIYTWYCFLNSRFYNYQMGRVCKNEGNKPRADSQHGGQFIFLLWMF